MCQVVGIEDHKDLVFLLKMLYRVFDGFRLGMEGYRRLEYIDPGIIIIQIADITVIRDDIGGKVRIDLFLQGVDDRGKEGGFLVAGNDNAEPVIFRRGLIGGSLLSFKQFYYGINQEDQERLDKEGSKKYLKDYIQVPKNCKNHVHVKIVCITNYEVTDYMLILLHVSKY